MIYFGWDGWGPWNTWQGSIWFCAGFIFLMIYAAVSGMIHDRKSWKNWFAKLVLFFWFFLATASLAGYYGWFAGVRAQISVCNQGIAEINKKVEEWKANGCK